MPSYCNLTAELNTASWNAIAVVRGALATRALALATRKYELFQAASVPATSTRIARLLRKLIRGVPGFNVTLSQRL